MLKRHKDERRAAIHDFYARLFGVEPRKKHNVFGGYPVANTRRKNSDLPMDPPPRPPRRSGAYDDPDDVYAPEPADRTQALSDGLEDRDDDDDDDDRDRGRAADDDGDDDFVSDNDGASPTGAATRHLDELADLLVAAHPGEINKAAALRWLLYTQPGRTMLARTHHYLHKKEEEPMNLISIAKQHGWRTLCKHLIENGTGPCSEEEITSMLTSIAQKSYPDLKPDQAFSKLYSSQTPDGELARRTTTAARDTAFASRYTTLEKAAPGMPGRATLQPRLGNPGSVKTALAALQELVDAQRAQNPALSESAAWQIVYTHPKNRALAEQERRENRPVAGW